MTATVVLVRHGSHDRLGKILCGRMTGVELSDAGNEEASRAAGRLAEDGIDAVYSSPLERAVQTARPIALAAEVGMQMEDALVEIDFGSWTGRNFDALSGDPEWTAWNERRARTRPPGGESMAEAQHRVLEAVHRLGSRHDGGRIVLVSHGDVIKAAACAALDLSLDHYDRFEISPASATVLVVGAWGLKLHSMNEAPPCP